MVYSLTYRRPSRVSSLRDSMNGEEKRKSINESITSSSSCMSHGIPDALSFDRIIAGGTCPPCTTREFMNYLKYIEHNAELLQFYLWFRDYEARFAALPESEMVLSPAWKGTQNEADAAGNEPDIAGLRHPDFAGSTQKVPTAKADPFDTPDKTPSLEEEKREGMSSEYATSSSEGRTTRSGTTYQSVASSAFDDAGLKWKPFTAQPFRVEVSRIISAYIAEGSPRELNISGRERQAVLHALQHTTHPSAFRAATTSVEYSLRRQAHPNFIRWTICNGNPPRVAFARGLGVFLILAGLLIDLLLVLSSASRAWRVIAFPAWFIGISTLIAAWKGMCVVLHGLHHRHVRPWELFSDDTEDIIDEKGRMSSESFNSESTNSFEDERWVATYKKRNVIRKIFDRQTWITEPALRQIQDTIFVQSLLGAFVLSCVFVGIFCAVPKGNFY